LPGAAGQQRLAIQHQYMCRFQGQFPVDTRPSKEMEENGADVREGEK
jgi:hypothetical protein